MKNSRTKSHSTKKSNNRLLSVMNVIAVLLVVCAFSVVAFLYAAFKDAHRIPNSPIISFTAEAKSPNAIPATDNTLVSAPQTGSSETVAEVPTTTENTVESETELSPDTATEPEYEDLPPIYEGEFELPITGARAYPSVLTELYADDGSVITKLAPGSELEIVVDTIGEDMWKVKTSDGSIGNIYHLRCMINLADIIPSLILHNTNSEAAVYRSSGIDIPNVTNEKLYDVKEFNERLGEDEFVMAVLFSTAKKIMNVQQEALSEGYSLCIYETYRPAETQKLVSANLKKLAASNSVVENGITGHGWGESWFISQGTSNHQRGYAMDVSLAKVIYAELRSACGYSYLNIIGYEELEMPSPMHELSDSSVVFTYGVNSKSATAWKTAPLAPTMNDAAILLQNYCTNNGFTPLASEWWHFNDLETKEAIGSNASDGNYYLQVGTVNN